MNTENQQPVSTYLQSSKMQETEEQKTERIHIFQALFLPSIIYACISTLLLYKNFNSITMPLFVFATFCYCFYCIPKFLTLKKKSFSLYIIGMMLLGISTCCTGSLPLQIFNFFGILLLLFCMLCEQYFNVCNWTITKYAIAFCNTIGGTISTISDFFTDMNCFRKSRTNTRNTKVGYVLLGVGISIPFLILITALFCSADAVFADVIGRIFNFDFYFEDLVGIVFSLIFILLASYCTLRFLNKRTISEDIPDLRTFEPIIANTILSLTAVLYLIFSSIQILYLFIGGLTLPEGYTYAEYAREGFFQLLAVCILNIILVLFFLACFKENLLLKVLLTVISCCTYIMLASSALRMCMYIREYHLTFLRIFVLWFLLLLAIILIGVIAAIYRREFPLFRYMLITISICYITFSFAHPDYWIAKYNLSPERQASSAIETDTLYLQYKLSSDAAPVIADCDKDMEWFEDYKERMIREYYDNVRKFNFSNWRAYELFK